MHTRTTHLFCVAVFLKIVQHLGHFKILSSPSLLVYLSLNKFISIRILFTNTLMYKFVKSLLISILTFNSCRAFTQSPLFLANIPLVVLNLNLSQAFIQLILIVVMFTSFQVLCFLFILLGFQILTKYTAICSKSMFMYISLLQLFFQFRFERAYFPKIFYHFIMNHFNLAFVLSLFSVCLLFLQVKLFIAKLLLYKTRNLELKLISTGQV